ncbi:guanine nucleotide exchange factor C9orf72-like isoform X1 [Biomphalaria glabrata]|uniref:Guanine nucleotide exchange factor C9orf72-like isoform X1 n=1 Tax=Biomphalaria glabrata TaxID=6526 RepID=A0A9W3AEU1_BIOGL|nr:guanine nucleotide exchange factor C9orf72-like isoform X1 [Biomphalaria glabrata]XP_055885773.1 guanine nucleotide exchange factor C9orf72-like isoform X1 [Biomphalaria glabrata]
MATASIKHSCSSKSLSLDSGVMTITSEDSYKSDFDDNSLTPLSPSSTYTVSAIPNIEHSYIDALILCQWDNILGPRLDHVWYVTGRPQPHTNILRFVTGQVLSGEICRDVHTSQVDIKFVDIPDKGVIIPAFIFSAQGSRCISLQSLALIIPNSELTIYLHQADLIHSWFSRIVAKLRVLCAKKDFGTSGLADLSSWLLSCLEMLSSLQTVGLPPTIQLSYTAFHPSNSIEQDFLRSVIASHLMTFSRSVVMGLNDERVNILVYTLGLFCWDSERFCSRAALKGKKWPYYQDLCVQGCTKNPDGSYNLSVRDLLCSQYPTTIIDVERREVMQSSSVLDHRRLSYETLLEELRELYEGEEGYGNSPSRFYQPVNSPESIIKDLIEDIHKLPPDYGVREAYVRHFMHSLQRRAFCLIKYVEGEVTSGARISVKRIKQDLGLQLEGDFRITLAVADKMKPGIYHYLLGEKKYDTEYLPNPADVL